jgi:hypothetical protein
MMFTVVHFFEPNTIREVKKTLQKIITWHYVNATEHGLAGERGKV